MGGSCKGGSVTLGGTGGEVGEKVGAQWVARVEPLHSAQVAGNLGHALPEAQRQEVQGESVGVEITCRQKRAGLTSRREAGLKIRF